MKIVEPICLSCSRVYGFKIKTCLAFPEGIPDEIWEGKNNHSKPYLGDNGIIFKRKGEVNEKND